MQGLYDSIADASVLKIPIYITETGLADKADKYRGWYIKATYDMVSRCFACRGLAWGMRGDTAWESTGAGTLRRRMKW